MGVAARFVGLLSTMLEGWRGPSVRLGDVAVTWRRGVEAFCKGDRAKTGDFGHYPIAGRA